jgi:hypothetical protein
MEWWDFHSKVCKRMGVNPATAQLGYHQFHDILYRSLHRLRGAGNWEGAIMRMQQANDDDAATELEIIDVARPTLVSITCIDRLLIDVPDVEFTDYQQGRKAVTSSLHSFCQSSRLRHRYRDILLLVSQGRGFVEAGGQQCRWVCGWMVI